MHSLNLTSNHQWMVVGVTGRHGNHAVWRVERETGHVLANALIQRQNGMERIALGPIPTLRAAICPSVKVDVFFWKFFFFLNDSGLFWCSCIFTAFHFGVEKVIDFWYILLLYCYGHENVFLLALLPARWQNGIRPPRAKRATKINGKQYTGELLVK